MITQTNQKKQVSMKFRDSARYLGELKFLILHEKHGLMSVCTIRSYISQTGNTNYCAIWLRTPDLLDTEWGGGKDGGGWGYDRQSAAVSDTFRNMGYYFEGDDALSGTGMTHVQGVVLRFLQGRFSEYTVYITQANP